MALTAMSVSQPSPTNSRNSPSEERLLAARRGIRVEGVTAEQAEVPRVRAEDDVEQVAKQWDRADREVDEQVHHHPAKHDARDAEPGGLEDDPRPDDPGDRVADERDQADDRVEADARAGAWHGERARPARA